MKIKGYLAVGFGGMIGACLRYGASLLFSSGQEIGFPWGTFIVNITGAFLLSFILFLPFFVKRVGPLMMAFLTTGIIGSYTTFSTFSLEVVQLAVENVIMAILYPVLTIVIGFFCSFLGFKLAKLVQKQVTT